MHGDPTAFANPVKDGYDDEAQDDFA